MVIGLCSEGIINKDSSPTVGVLSTDARAYFDELVEKIMVDNQVREDQIMSQIEFVAKDAKEICQKIKEEVKTEIQASEARVMVEVEIVKCGVDLFRSTTFVFSIDPSCMTYHKI